MDVVRQIFNREEHLRHLLSDESEYYPNEKTMKVLEEIERGENMHGPFATVAELMEALNAPD